MSICAVLLVCGMACGGSQAEGGREATAQVRGHVIEVVARSITEVETLRIRDDAGQEYTFTSEGFTGFTPSHLKEHQLFGQTVLVFFLETAGRLVALEITD